MSRFAYPFLQLLRTPVKTAFFTLLMVLAGTLLCLSVGLYGAAYDVTRDMDSQYTTIAIPNVYAMRDARGGHYEKTESGMKYSSDSIPMLSDMRKDALSTPLALPDRIGAFMAVSSSINPLLPPSSQSWYMEPYDTILLEVKCLENSFEVSNINNETPSYDYTLQIEQVVSAFQKLQFIPSTISFSSYYFNEGGSPLFEIGKRYLVLGRLINSDFDYYMELPDIPINHNKVAMNDISYTTLIPDLEATYIPWLEIPGDIDVFDFTRNNEDAQLLRRICDDTYHSLTVLATDKLYSIFGFASGSARIVQGRSYTKEEAASGERVCVISAGLAERNNLSVGDSLDLSKLYTTDFGMKFLMRATAHLPKLINPYARGYMEFEGGNYEVIGLYQAPEFVYDEYAISPNTVFLPASSIPDMPEFPISYSYSAEGLMFYNEDGTTATLSNTTMMGYLEAPLDVFTVIINNGSVDDFRTAMEKIRPGYSSMFIYYDGSYSLAKSVYAAVENNVRWVLLAAVAVWAVVTVLYLLLFVGKQKHDAGIMRSLGARRKLVAGQIVVQGLMMMIIVTLICILAGNLLYNSVIKIACAQALAQNGVSTVFSSLEGSAAEVAGKLENAFTINKNYGTIVLTGAAQFSLIMLLTITSGVALSKTNILSLLRKRG